MLSGRSGDDRDHRCDLADGLHRRTDQRADVHIRTGSCLPTPPRCEVPPSSTHSRVSWVVAPVEVARTGLESAVDPARLGERVDGSIGGPNRERARDVVAGRAGNVKVAGEVDGAIPEHRELCPASDRNATAEDDRAPIEGAELLRQLWSGRRWRRRRHHLDVAMKLVPNRSECMKPNI